MKTKVLIITGKLQNYRIPLFNEIVRRGIDLTVAHSFKKLDDGSFLFKELYLDEKKIGPFTIHKNSLRKLASKYDVVIPTFYLQKLSFMSLLFGSRNFKLAYWGIGVKASQNSRYDTPTILNQARYLIAKHSDAMIFYSDYPRNKYINRGIGSEKLFVMNNTVHVDPQLVDLGKERNIIVFIGTLNKSKKIFELVNAYYEVSQDYELPILEIIGGGPDLKELENWVEGKYLSEKIKIHGPIYNPIEKAGILNKALCAISPDQAGLSVLEAMAYGIPFITHQNAITGGERFNINKNNGILFEDFEDLNAILVDVHLNREKYIKMGVEAHKFYNRSRTIHHFVNEFMKTIKFLENERIS